jgi:hypothetical protein
LKWSLDYDKIKYSMCAEEICFKNKPLSEFFALVKTFPILRFENKLIKEEQDCKTPKYHKT